MELIERFLKYVSFDTQSSEEGEGCPSTDKQMVFARYLENELKAIGLEEVSLDEHGYLYATLPANTEREVPTIYSSYRYFAGLLWKGCEAANRGAIRWWGHCIVR